MLLPAEVGSVKAVATTLGARAENLIKKMVVPLARLRSFLFWLLKNQGLSQVAARPLSKRQRGLVPI
jgi:hypothetical protein